MEQDKEDLDEKDEDKFQTKDKITAGLYIVIIIIFIIILSISVKKYDNKDSKTKEKFKIKTLQSTYTMLQSDTIGLGIELNCDPLKKVNITVQKGSIFNTDNNEILSTLSDNEYELTCSKQQIIYWKPDNNIIEDEIINIEFKPENKKQNSKTIKILKQENENYLVLK